MTRWHASLLLILVTGCNQGNDGGVGGAKPAASTRGPTESAGVATAVSQTFRPEKRDFSQARLKDLKLPVGFKVDVYARDLQNARMLAIGPDGTVYLSRRTQGDVLALPDRNNDGKADDSKTALKLKDAHGLFVHGNTLYVATVKEVYTVPINPDASLGQPKKIIENLPDGGQHPNRTLAIGPDNKLYVTVGSSCNQCPESNEEHATVLQFNPDGSGRRIYAKGLRNTIGFGWHPQTKEMWGMDHGSDGKGNDVPPEELNRIVDNGDYGWPWVYDKQKPDPTFTNTEKLSQKGLTVEQYAKLTEPPALLYQAHSAPLGLAFYTADQFPSEYKDDAFVAMRGSWNRAPSVGYKVVRIRFADDGKPERIEDFMTGFLVEDGKAHFGRLAGVAVARDGALLVAEDTNGVIYRVTHAKQ